MKEENKILIPSFEVERRTQGLNRGLWGFVGLISMFTVGLGVWISHLMFVNIFGIVDTFLSSTSILVTLVLTLPFALVFGFGLYHFFNPLLHSYEFCNDKIIKGKIVSSGKAKAFSTALQAQLLAYMAANMDNSSRFYGAHGTTQLLGMIQCMIHNLDRSFVEEFFHTDVYKKEEYGNPQLIKETKRYFLYSCDNKKKLKIYKIYTGMADITRSPKGPSMLKRVLTKSLLVLLVFALLSTADLAIGAAGNKENLENIQLTYSEIERNLKEFGYTADKTNEKTYRFEKVVSPDRTSYVQYYFRSDGQMADVKFELYYNANSADMPAELRYILDSATDDSSNTEILSFIDNVQKTIHGKPAYDILESGDSKIRLGTSSGYAHIHN